MSVQDFDFLTLGDVADLLHCSKAHICKAVAGRVSGCPPIPAVSLGRRRLIRRQSLIDWLEANEKAASSGTIPASPERGRKDA
jgi:excisionase family DNA binding protein